MSSKIKLVTLHRTDHPFLFSSIVQSSNIECRNSANRANLQMLSCRNVYFKMVLKIIMFLSCAVLVLASDAAIPIPPISPDPILPSSSTAPNTSTTTTSPSPTTSKTTHMTTTTKSPTTSRTSTTSSTTPATPTTSPTPPSTSPTPPSTSPTPPTTAPTTKSTTTVTPKPDDKPSVNEYVGNYTGSLNICLLVKMALQIELLHDENLINVPKSVNYTAACPKNDHEELSISWGNNSVIFGFFKNNSVYEIQYINTTIQLGPNKTEYYHLKPEFAVSEKMSYYCVKDQPLNLTDGKSNVTLGKIHISHMQYQAFMNTTKAQYDSVWDCDGVNTSDVVPVVVGCVLAVLVVLVLVAYLFGRRRCQARGYLSMFAEERSERDYIPLKTLSCFK